MDQLPENVQIAICDYLPWSDRLTSLELANKFRTFSCRRLLLGVLAIRQEENTFSFTAKYYKQDEVRRIIEIVRDDSVVEAAPGYQQSKTSECRGGEVTLRMTIRCPSSRYCQFVCAYMDYFSSYFHVEVLQLVRLSSDYLVKFDEKLQQKPSYLHWVFDQLELYPCNSELSTGERKFLERSKYPFYLAISSPLNFTLPDDFWTIAAVSGAAHLILDYGREEPPEDGYSAMSSTYKTDVELQLGDEIVKQLVEDKKESLVVNGVTNISADFILEYIENAFSLKHAMYTLAFQHKYDENELLRIQGWLKANGFVGIPRGGVVKNIGTKTKRGFNPDRIVVTIDKHRVMIEGDYAYYRGEKTIMDPYHPISVKLAAETQNKAARGREERLRVPKKLPRRTVLLPSMLVRITVFLILAFTAQGASSRDRRQACECSAGEEPQCGCQVVPSSDPVKTFQMLCTCSQPVPPKCVCRETPPVRQPFSPTTASQVTSAPTAVTASITTTVRCVDVCKKSCQQPCSRLSSGTKCDQVCAEACVYSCGKQEKSSQVKKTVVSEYRFVLPSSSSTPATLIPSPTPSTTTIVLGNSITSSPKTCDPACMPECNFVCTTFKPALKLVTDAIEKSSSPGKCQQNCGETCVRVCATTGVALAECANNCGNVCNDTCNLVTKKNCVPQCQPACTQQCIQIQTEIQVPGGFPPQPAVVVTATSSPPSAAVEAQCQNECSIQCEHQCGVHSLAGPQCLAACQTTCYPVCQAKLKRRKHMRPRIIQQ